MKRTISFILASLMAMMFLTPVTAYANQSYGIAVSTQDELQQAINISGGAVVLITQDIALQQSALTVDGRTAVVDLNGHTITSAWGQPVFMVEGGRLTIQDSRGNGQIKSNQSLDHQSPVIRISGTDSELILAGGAVIGIPKPVGMRDPQEGRGGTGIKAEDGASVELRAPAEIRDCAVYAFGGGVSLTNGSSFTMQGGAIRNCASTTGGGVYLDATSSFTMMSGVIDACQAVTTYAGGDGGGVYNGGTFTMMGGTISNCTADGSFQAGGVYGGNFYMSGTAQIIGCRTGLARFGSAELSGNAQIVQCTDSGIYQTGGYLVMKDAAQVVGCETGITVGGNSTILIQDNATVTENRGANGGIELSGGELRLSGMPVISGNSSRDNAKANVILTRGAQIVLKDELKPSGKVGLTLGAGYWDEEMIITNNRGQLVDRKDLQGIFFSDVTGAQVTSGMLKEGHLYTGNEPWPEVVTEDQGVYLNPETLHLEVGEMDTLTATVFPEDAQDKTVTWSSSNQQVAKVKNGMVTAVGVGSAIITATSKSGFSATCLVTVTAPVKSVSLNRTTLTLETGQAFRLTATVLPADAADKTVAWVSSDPQVARVASDGTVTAVAPGTGVVTARAANGKSADCVVTVTAPQTQPTPPEEDAADANIRAFVTRLYEKCLGRAPDASGMNTWYTVLKDGSWTAERVAWGFVFSKEYTNRHTTNDAYVRMLYRVYMDREPDPSGYDTWMGVLYRGEYTREQVMEGFSRSVEFKNICARYGMTPW